MSVPSWQLSELDELAQNSQLYGIAPGTMASILQAEEPPGGQDLGINSNNDGGYFGLNDQSQYPGGSVSAATLETAGTASFAQEATIAASDLASLITQYGGNMQQAIGAYDGAGPGGGFDYQVYLSNGGSPTGTANPSQAANAQLTNVNANPLDLFGIPQTILGGAASSAASAVWGAVGPFLVKSILVVTGLSLMVVGAIKMTSPGRSVRTIAADLPRASSAPAAAGGGSGAAAGMGDLPELAAA